MLSNLVGAAVGGVFLGALAMAGAPTLSRSLERRGLRFQLPLAQLATAPAPDEAGPLEDDEPPEARPAAAGEKPANKGAIKGAIEKGAERSLERLYSESIENRVEDRLFEDYHDSTLQQGNWIFRLAMFAGLVGLGMIMFSFYEAVSATGPAANAQNALLMKTAVGGTLEAVCGLFFKLSQDRRKDALSYYEGLHDARRCREAVAMASKIKDPALQGVMLAQISAHMAGFKVANKEVDLTCVLTDKTAKGGKLSKPVEPVPLPTPKPAPRGRRKPDTEAPPQGA